MNNYDRNYYAGKDAVHGAARAAGGAAVLGLRAHRAYKDATADRIAIPTGPATLIAKNSKYIAGALALVGIASQFFPTALNSWPLLYMLVGLGLILTAHAWPKTTDYRTVNERKPYSRFGTLVILAVIAIAAHLVFGGMSSPVKPSLIALLGLAALILWRSRRYLAAHLINLPGGGEAVNYAPEHWPWNAPRFIPSLDPNDPRCPDAAAAMFDAEGNEVPNGEADVLDQGGEFVVALTPRPGQDYSMVTGLAERFSTQYQAKYVSETRDGLATVYSIRRNPLADRLSDVVKWGRDMFRAEPLNPSAVPLGLDAFGSPVLVPVMGRSTYVVGQSGAGKGGVMWSMVSQMARRPEHDLFGADVKRLELGSSLVPSGLFQRVATTPQDILDMMKWMQALMHERIGKMAMSGQRDLNPTPDMPSVTLVMDEGAATWGQVQAAGLGDEFKAVLLDILSQGRAAGVAVWVFSQDTRADAFPYRQFFTQRICLRLTRQDQGILMGGDSLEAFDASVFPLEPKTARGRFAVALDGGGFLVGKSVRLDDDDIRNL